MTNVERVSDSEKEEFIARCRKFDRTFHFSDCSRTYRNGETELRNLRYHAKRIGVTAEEFKILTGHEL